MRYSCSAALQCSLSLQSLRKSLHIRALDPGKISNWIRAEAEAESQRRAARHGVQWHCGYSPVCVPVPLLEQNSVPGLCSKPGRAGADNPNVRIDLSSTSNPALMFSLHVCSTSPDAFGERPNPIVARRLAHASFARCDILDLHKFI